MNTLDITKKLKQHPVIKGVYQISQKSGTPIYLVGGAVRDLLMGIFPEKDFDFVTGKNPGTVARQFSRIVSGNLIQWSSDPPNYRVFFYRNSNQIVVDFSGFRGDDIHQDLVNRDFTVNAMALLVDELFQKGGLNLYDPLKGEKDLKQRNLRITSPHSFDDDPLRILRAVRIAKAGHLIIDPVTKEDISRKKERLRLVAPERIRTEFFKIIRFPEARESLIHLEELGLLSFLLPETTTLKRQHKEEDHGLPPWEHALQTVRWCEWALDNPGKIFPECQNHLRAHFSEEIEADVDRHSLVKLAGVLHDYKNPDRTMESPLTVPSGGNGKQIRNSADSIAGIFKLGKRARRTLRNLVTRYGRVFHLFQMKRVNKRACFQFFRELGPDGLDVLVLSWADFVSRFPDRFESPLDLKVRNLINDLANYYVNEYIVTGPQPLISGKDIIKKFGFKEGKIIGALLHQVAIAEAESILSSRKEALLYIENLIKRREA